MRQDARDSGELMARAIDYDEEMAEESEEPTRVAALRELERSKKSDERPRPAAGMPPMSAAPAMMPAPARAPGFAAPEAKAMAAPMGAPMPQSMAMADAMSRAAGPKGGGGLFRARAFQDADVGAMGAMDDLQAAIDEGPIEPADAWLDFDSLRLSPGAPGARAASAGSSRGRGRLSRAPGASALRAEAAAQAMERLEAPSGAVDPRASRGLFDVVYRAAGTVDVPSSGRPHRITVATADAAAAPKFVTVPREAAEVYRRADVANPFGVALLTGPVEVLIDGALVALTRLSYTDRAGQIAIGLGVEERLKVARNARIDEGTAGLLGGSTTVDHAVTTELSSSLGRAVRVKVLDRIPVSDDKDVDVKLTGSSPQPSVYTQADLGQPVRKGLEWEIEVPPGGKAKVEWRYRITLPSKMEVVGGNRRE